MLSQNGRNFAVVLQQPFGLLGATATMLPLYSIPHNEWQRSRSVPNLEPYLTFPKLNKLRLYGKWNILCFLLFMCACRVNSLANSQMDVRATHFPSLKGQNVRQDMKWNTNISRYHERPLFSRLNEIDNIKFNTGVSKFTKNVNLVYLAWVLCVHFV